MFLWLSSRENILICTLNLNFKELYCLYIPEAKFCYSLHHIPTKWRVHMIDMSDDIILLFIASHADQIESLYDRYD